MATMMRSTRAVFTPPKGNRQLEQAQFAEKVLKQLGVPFTQLSMIKFMAWEQQEGGHWNNSAKYNPLNTTLALPGAGNTGAQGNIKVYRSWQQGVEATVKTLAGSAYSGILANLRGKGNLASFEQAVNASPWGTNFPGGGKGGGEGRGPSSIPGGETNLPEDVKKAATGWVKELTEWLEGAIGEAGKKIFAGSVSIALVIAGLLLVVYGVKMAISPRETATSIPTPKVLPIPV